MNEPFDPTELITPGEPFDTGTARGAVIQGEQARQRAIKFHIALGQDSPGVESILNSISIGEEDNFRQLATQAISKQQQARALSQVVNLAAIGSVSPQVAQEATANAKNIPVLDHNVAPEQAFADKYVAAVLSNPSSQNIVNQALSENSSHVKQAVEGANKVAALREIARKGLEDATAKYQEQTWGQWGKNVAKGMIPLMTGIEQSPDYNPANILLPGSSLEKERETFWSFRDLSIAKQWLDGRIEAIAKENPNAALSFAHAMVDLPEGQIIAGNVFGVGDVSNVGSLITAAGKGAVTALVVKKMIKDSLKDGIGPRGEVSAERTAAALGDIKTAADMRSAREIFQGMDPAMVGHEVADQVPLIMKPSLIQGPGADSLVRERTQRLIPELKAQGADLMTSLSDSVRPPRLPESVLKSMLAHASDMMDIHYPSVNHGVLETRLFYEQANNIFYAERVIGKRNGLLLDTIDQAQRYSEKEYGLGHGSFSIKDAEELANDFITKIKQGDVSALETKLGKSLDADNAVRDQLKKIEPTLKGSKSTSELQEVLNKTIIRQQGTKYYISIIKPLDETHMDTARKMLLTTENTNPVTFGNWVFSLFGKTANIRSAEDILGEFQRGNRHIAIHVPQEIQRHVVEIAKNIGGLSKESHDALGVILNRNKDYVEHDSKGGVIRGKAYGNQQQLDKEWFDAHGRIPTYEESKAYWSYHQLMGTDWIIRNFGVHRDLARQGAERFTTMVGDKELSFIGRFEKELPLDSPESFGLAIIDNGVTKHYWKGSLTAEETDMLKTMTREGGYKVLQIGNPVDRPLSTPGIDIGQTVNFVIVRQFETKPLEMNLVDWNPGVHIVHPQSFKVAVPVTAVGEKGILRGYSDKILFLVDTGKEARQYTKSINEVGDMIKAKATDAELNDFIYKNLPEDAAYWKQKFNTFIGFEHKVGAVASGRKYWDHYPELRPPGLVEETNSSYNLFRSIDMDFLANRDGPIDTIAKTGKGAGSPMYTLEKARTLDPFESVSRGLNNGIRSLINNDQKISAIEQWAAQYAHLATDSDYARSNPWSFFYNYIKLNERIASETGRRELASAEASRQRTLQFVGTASENGRDISIVQQKLLNALSKGDPDQYSKLNPQHYLNARWYTDHELKLLKDPVAFTRSWMTHFRFGFFNPDQILVQGMGSAHVLAVAGPTAAWKGMSAYVTMRAAGMTEHPETLNRLANIASAFGWKKEEWKESYNLMRNIGLDIIGREHSMRYESFDPSVYVNTSTKASSISMKPFTEGERLTRVVAWNAAYHEFRKENPFKEITQFDIPKILTRADDLSANMTKASHSTLQEGIFKFPTQFFTFSQRMLEQFWGGRLSNTEKARAFATHAALFGIPVTAAIGIPWPIYDSLKTHLLETGNTIVDEKWFKAVNDGMLSFFTTMITGKEYNVNQRYGPGFSDVFKKLWDNEIGVIEAAGGATGTFLNNVLKSTYPFTAHLYVGLLGKEGDRLPILKEDILGLVREVSSVNNLHNAIYAANTGKYLSKSGEWVAGSSNKPLDWKDAAAMMMGLTRTDITDTRLMIGGLKDQVNAQKRIQVLAEREFKRAFTAADPSGTNDMQKAETHFARASALMRVMGDFKDEMISETYKRAVEENQPLVDRIKKSFTEKGNKSQLPARLQRLFDGK
jgi:hypothetical protein